MLSKTQDRTGESGEMASRGSVTEKWGERRWKSILRKSCVLPLANDVMVEEISFCQSERVLITTGPVCSKVHFLALGAFFLLLRAYQRKF